MKHALTIAAMTALIGLPTAQAATTTSFVKLSDLALFAFDLLPNDGLSPSFELLTPGPYNNTTITSSLDPSQTVAGFLSPMTYSGFTATSHAQAAVGPSGVEVFASVEGTDDHTLEVSASTGSGWLSVLHVAPGTGIVLSGQLDMGVCGAQYLYCDSTASFSINLGGQYFDISRDSHWSTANYSNTVGLAYTNYTDAYQDVGLELRASTQLRAPTVPEPSAYALVMAGGLVAGWLGRRRQRQA